MSKMGWFGVVMGHPRSLKIAPFNRAHTHSILTMCDGIGLAYVVGRLATPTSMHDASGLAAAAVCMMLSYSRCRSNKYAL